MDTTIINGKKVPIIKATTHITLKNMETGVLYKNEEEWKKLGIEPAQIQRDVKIILPKLDLFAKTK